MQFIEKHKALLLTTLVFLVLFLGLYNWHLGSSARKSPEFLVDLDSFTQSLQEEEEEEEEEYNNNNNYVHIDSRNGKKNTTHIGTLSQARQRANQARS